MSVCVCLLAYEKNAESVCSEPKCHPTLSVCVFYSEEDKERCVYYILS